VDKNPVLGEKSKRISDDFLNFRENVNIFSPDREVLKIKPCKRNNRQNSDNTKNAAKQGNAEERPDAGCGIKR